MSRTSVNMNNKPLEPEGSIFQSDMLSTALQCYCEIRVSASVRHKREPQISVAEVAGVFPSPAPNEKSAPQGAFFIWNGKVI
ncbi:hypothetical protein [Paenibacillus sp. NAIST15-1]|uniref:hypothetical protein n=1 Tax=Paenibacillus sp. NAIST15-1 TaxID=1605994 RepID=UPI0009354483|nr:hypothetical protein [Paenibacillus sp. NAIST15-1]